MEPAAGAKQPTRSALLCSSLLLNAVFIAHHLFWPTRLGAGDSCCGLSWALQAAREAEAVAATDCSGHGQVWRRMSYTTTVYALSPDANDADAPPARVVSAVPYYGPYKSQTEMFDGREYVWGGTTSVWVNASRNSTGGFIEFVTSPNNPDAQLRKPVLGGGVRPRLLLAPLHAHPGAGRLGCHDVHHVQALRACRQQTGVCSWALIRDEMVAKRAYNYVTESILGASRDTQTRMLKIIKVILANLHTQEDIFAFGHDVMRTRWRRLNAIVSRSQRISLQKLPPQYCSYFKRVREPSPAYAWVKCEREEDEDCHEALLKANIITRTGVTYEASERYMRVSLLKSDDDFDVLIERFTDLVNAEYDASGFSSV
ncbi:hypothetical protein PR202_ga09874 [Eleusine coracana subsp. coracana]|uniref:Alliinase C-terminal domain-containing protein n=1 Tax=Eleusine coracana subsp. coracana TaxID=191504 RepID=A0AAV5C5F9_ELECO|nr:hypothetical protein PR202_ga09874 [Eleusine coracana subsp. coracana]